MLTRPTVASGPSQPHMTQADTPVATSALLPLRAVAELLALSPLSVRRLVVRGELRAYRIVRHLRFRRADVEKLINRAQVNTPYGRS